MKFKKKVLTENYQLKTHTDDFIILFFSFNLTYQEFLITGE